MQAAAKTETMAEGRPEIKREWCKSCGICVAFCPRKALSLDDEEKATLDPEKCNGCGVCELFCPDFAIVVKGAGRSCQG